MPTPEAAKRRPRDTALVHGEAGGFFDDRRKAKRDLRRHVTGFANAASGVLIVGVGEPEDKGERTYRSGKLCAERFAKQPHRTVVERPFFDARWSRPVCVTSQEGRRARREPRLGNKPSKTSAGLCWSSWTNEHSLCQVAGEKRIFCHGFKQWSDSELFRRFAWIAERRKVKTRPELEEIANPGIPSANPYWGFRSPATEHDRPTGSHFRMDLQRNPRP